MHLRIVYLPLFSSLLRWSDREKLWRGMMALPAVPFLALYKLSASNFPFFFFLSSFRSSFPNQFLFFFFKKPMVNRSQCASRSTRATQTLFSLPNTQHNTVLQKVKSGGFKKKNRKEEVEEMKVFETPKNPKRRPNRTRAHALKQTAASNMGPG